MTKWTEIALWKRVLAALILGAIVGVIWGPGAESIGWLGDMFIRLIRMVIVPLVFLTLVSGVIAMGDPKRLGSLGAKTLSLYIGTTGVAILIGLTLAALIEPGAGVEFGSAQPKELAEAKPLAERLLDIIPRNPIAAFANGEMLAVIFFGLFFGATLMLTGDKAKPVVSIMESGGEVMIKMTHLVMEVAPLGVFALIARTVGVQGLDVFAGVAPLALTIVAGCFIHMALTHGFIIKVLLGLPPVRFFKDIIEAQLVAFSTSSSSATLPITIATAEDNLGVKTPVAGSVLPLGATINMDGTAIYVGVVSVFSLQALGIPMGMMDYLMIAGLTTLVSIGTAAVPSASLFLLAIVLGEFSIPEVQIATIVGFLFAFDRPLDMLRTVVNVTGDLSVASAVGKWEGELDEEVFRADPKV